MEPVISVRGIVNRFGHQVVHDGLDMEVMPGEVFGIVGGSGTGKSVLLRTMLGLQHPAAGTVTIEGRDITTATARELLETKRRYGVTFQQGALFSSLTVAQNVELSIAEYYEVGAATLRELAGLKIRLVGLPADAAGKYPSQLSGGMTKARGARSMGYEIRKAAVLGAGVMGSGIAAQFANAGIPVLLLDIVPPNPKPGQDTSDEAWRNSFAGGAVDKMAKAKPTPPTPLMTRRALT